MGLRESVRWDEEETDKQTNILAFSSRGMHKDSGTRSRDAHGGLRSASIRHQEFHLADLIP